MSVESSQKSKGKVTLPVAMGLGFAAIDYRPRLDR
jgi:hypothetical protein